MFGKRGENPTLPRNCKRRELGRQVTAATGDGIPGKVAQIRRGVSQETGSARTNFRGENEIYWARPSMRQIFSPSASAKLMRRGGARRNGSGHNCRFAQRGYPEGESRAH